MIEAFWNPRATSEKMKDYSWGMIITYLIITAFLLFFAVKINGLTWGASALAALAFIIATILGALGLTIALWAWATTNYRKSLAILVLPWFIMSVGFLVGSILNLIPYIGAILAGLLTLLVMPLAVITQLRALMSAFKLDLLVAIVILLVLYVTTTAAVFNILGALSLQLATRVGFGFLPLAFP